MDASGTNTNSLKQILSMEQYLQMLSGGTQKAGENCAPKGWVGSVADAPSRAAVNSREERYEKMLAAVTDYRYAVTINQDGAIRTFHNDGCEKLTGYTLKECDENPHLWHFMVHQEDRHAVMNHVLCLYADECLPPLEHRIVCKDGTVRWIRNTFVLHHDERGRLVSYDGLIQDITDRKRVEEQLYQAQKMEAVGALAGGVAHDFNNLITAIFGYIEVMKLQIEARDPLRKTLDRIVEATTKVFSVTRGLLSFSRKHPLQLAMIDLNEVVVGMGPLLRRLFSEDVELQLLPDAHAVMLTADKSRIEQVLLNLATNARDAMPSSGSVCIRVSSVCLSENSEAARGGSGPGAYAVLSVEDSGQGMDEETRKKIFEPFFTTKGENGTGLGLAITYGIVKQHGGHIDVHSEPGRGTAFNVYLPREGVCPVEVPTDAFAAIVGGNETVLVAEDDAMVRSLIKDSLERHGYTVLTSVDGEAALANFIANREVVSLVVLDTVMPKKGGKELYDDIRKIRPDIKVVFMSGYDEDVIRQKKLLADNAAFISKPMQQQGLLKIIRTVLDSSGHPKPAS